MDKQAATNPRRILVVDDNQDAADTLGLLLKQHDHLVVQAYDGPSAVEAALEFRPEVVFLDLMMPGMDGFDVAQRLRKLETMHTKRMVIVALTGHNEPAFREAGDEAGFDTFLSKPATAADVLGILAAA